MELAGGISTVRIEIDPARARRWHARLAERLTDAGLRVVVAPSGGGPPYPVALALLAWLERLTLERGREGAASPVSMDAFARWRGEAAVADVVIDLTARADTAPGALRALCDGHPGEEAAAAALLRGSKPMIAVAPDAPALTIAVEDPKRLVRALDQVCARLGMALFDAIRALGDGRGLARGAASARSAGWTPALSLGAFAREARRALERRLQAAPHWAIGWRRLSGTPLHESLTLPATGYAMLPDDGRRFLADPVLWRANGRTALFMEEFPFATGKGILSVVDVGPDGPGGPPRPVIERTGHLSYPFVFEHGGAIWLIPESSTERKLVLYRAVDFPDAWEEAAVLMDGVELHDATLDTLADGSLVLLANMTREGTSSWDTLVAYTAPGLLGPWTPHPANPLMVDALAARPAGRMIRAGGRLIRPAQDCRARYGAGLAFAEVTRLDREGFAQRLLGVVAPGPALPGNGLHAYDLLDGLEVVDVLRDRAAANI